MKILFQGQKISQKEYPTSLSRFTPETTVRMYLQVLRKHFHYLELNYLFLFYSAKTENKEKEMIHKWEIHTYGIGAVD